MTRIDLRAGIRWRRGAQALATLALVLACVPTPEATAAPPDADVIVVERFGAGDAPERAVERQGGTVTRQLPLINGFSASVPKRHVGALRRAPGVRSVVRDRRFELLSDETVAPDTGASLREVSATIGTSAFAAAGAGVDVAIVDSGVAPVAGFAPGQVVDGLDVSGDQDHPELRHRDGFGHGTHLAGVVAGVAPAARIVNVKVADHAGESSLGQVLAGIDWVVRNGRRDGLNVRVINLAFGAEVDGEYRDDPLAFAVEQAWQRGYAVVAAGGNGGAEATGLDSPAYDPYVIAVAGSDTAGTPDPSDDFVAEFSSRGTASRTPDVTAPGVGIVSLRVPGGLLDLEFPGARIGETHFRGSGTSQAAAVVSGAAARMLAERSLTPDEVKAVLRASARPLQDADALDQGAGLIDLVAARGQAVPAGAVQRHPKARGGGRWRGRGQFAPEWAVEHPQANRWSANRWSANRWSANRWSANRWSANRWSANRWSANRWSANRWSANRWSANRWSGSTWEAPPAGG